MKLLGPLSWIADDIAALLSAAWRHVTHDPRPHAQRVIDTWGRD